MRSAQDQQSKDTRELMKGALLLLCALLSLWILRESVFVPLHAAHSQPPVQRVKSSHAPAVAEIETLLNAYQQNSVAADAVYGDREVTVQGGVVHAVHRNPLGGVSIILVVMGDEFGVQPLRCSLAVEAQALALRTGDVVDVRGQLIGKSHLSVQLNKCTVTELQAEEN